MTNTTTTTEAETTQDEDAAAMLKLGWQRVVLVCRQCQKRGSGPSKLKAKTVVSALKTGLRRAPARTRVMLTGCLGPCPKKAITVVMSASDGGGPATGWAAADAGEARALGRLLGREAGAGAGAGGRAPAVGGTPDPV